MKDEKHKKALEEIKQRGQQLLKQHDNQKKQVPAPVKAEPKRIDSGLRKREEEVSPANVFNDEPKRKAAASPSMWPGQAQGDDIGLKIKNYIKDMNKLIDEEAKAPGDGDDQEEDEDEDDENIDELPAVPETDENSKQIERNDSVEDDEAIEEAKTPREDYQIIEPPPIPEPFRLDELRISAPQLRNELGDSLGFFETMLVETYGATKFQQALAILE